MARFFRDTLRAPLVIGLTALLVVGSAVVAAPAQADSDAGSSARIEKPGAMDDYNPKRAGHPLRILAYALHPVGVTIDYLILRPAYFIGHWQPFRTLFGRTDD